MVCMFSLDIFLDSAQSNMDNIKVHTLSKDVRKFATTINKRSLNWKKTLDKS